MYFENSIIFFHKHNKTTLALGEKNVYFKCSKLYKCTINNIYWPQILYLCMFPFLMNELMNDAFI